MISLKRKKHTHAHMSREKKAITTRQFIFMKIQFGTEFGVCRNNERIIASSFLL